MNELKENIEQLITQTLEHEGYKLLNFLPVPQHGDQCVRIKTLEDIFRNFDRDDDTDTQSYVIYVRQKKKQNAIKLPSNPQIYSSKSILDGIYCPNGKLNISFLLKNASVLFESREITLAKNIYKTVLRSGDSSAIALFGLSKCFIAEEKFSEAIKCLEESLSFHPKLETYQLLSRLLIKEDKAHEAAELLERALSLSDLEKETKVELYKAIGNSYFRARVFEKSEYYYRKAIHEFPLSDDIHYNLGLLYLQSKNFVSAKKYFNEACRINPKNSFALSGLGSCAFEEGDKKLALDYFIGSLEINLNNRYVIKRLIECAFVTESYSKAAQLLREFIQVSPFGDEILYSLAVFEFHLGKFQEAKTVLSKIIELNPKHLEAKGLLKIVSQKILVQ